MHSYVDYQSAKPVDPRVREVMLPYFHERFGNPSSLHGEGDEAAKVLEECRRTIASFINAEPDEIIFTSGATESNNLALIGYASRNREKGDHIIISEVEHISIHNIAKYLEKNGFKVSRLPVDQYGKINMKKLESRITPQTILISIGYASNEIGTIQPISEIGQLAREKGVTFHSDAVAAEGLIPLDVKRDHIDLLTLSSNDIYGPKGVGVLYMRKGMRLNPVIIGGGQERGLRSGTENIAGIVGMSKAVEIMQREMKEEVKRLAQYRDRFIKNILERIPKSHLNGHPTERLANNAHFRFEAIEGESLLLSLRDAGVSAATGSACSSKTLEPSHTLISTGLLHEEAHGSLEFTFGRFNKEEDVDRVIEVLPAIVDRLRKLSPLYKEEMPT
ncbi:MAG: cysteine desulfurase NifS [Deltaproteobacteria bacterium RBG_13_52_11]|nr:MAG: cysteine desulfurase NifS [Deltaproteobacteria bacterium RBG_13_52_11]